jgi:hypothetical protein
VADISDELVVAVQVEAAGLDSEGLDSLTQRLRLELLEMDVRSIEPATRGQAPPGTRAVDALAIGGLLVTLARSADQFRALVGVIQGWIRRQPDRTVELQIAGDSLKVGGVSAAEQQRLIELFIQRHTG